MARILVIEDNPNNLELITYLLGAFGHGPIAAPDGGEGLAIARRETPDLILCDIQLPDINGYDLARQFKHDPALRSIPLVAVTSFAMVGDRERVLSAGFDGYISKPIDPQKFVRQVEAFLPDSQRVGIGSGALEPGPNAVAAAAAPPAAAPGPTILVVDNSPVNLSLMRSTLEPNGYTVITAEGVEQGLSIARQVAPDLIISDLHMPKRNGFDFIRMAKADLQLRHLPFVFVSSTVWSDDDPATGLRLGATRFLIRPIEPDVLLKEIKASLEAAGK